MSRGESDFHCSENIFFCKWYNDKPVSLLVANGDCVWGVSKVKRRTKGSATNTPVSCPNIIKVYNNGTGSTDIMDQKQVLTDLIVEASTAFTWEFSLDLIDIALLNGHIAYTKFGNDISLLNFKIAMVEALICRCSNCERSFPSSRPSKR